MQNHHEGCCKHTEHQHEGCCKGVIVAHSHPSGEAEPSKADRQVTTRIQQALDLVDIRLLDHLVVGGMEITSFADRGWL